MEPIEYSKVRDRFDTGDIVLFSRKNLLMLLWKKITGCKWTHVGMVIKSEETQQILLWESTTLKNLCDQFSKTAYAGVQAVLLSQRVKTYKGDVAYRKLHFTLDKDAQRQMYTNLRKFRKKIQGTVFEKNLFELLMAYIDIFVQKKSSQSGQKCEKWSTYVRKNGLPNPFTEKSWSSIFCSELVAGAYQVMGLLDSSIKPAKEYTPKDFSSVGHGLKLLRGASLDVEKPIVFGCSGPASQG